jgi:hypothetical protein
MDTACRIVKELLHEEVSLWYISNELGYKVNGKNSIYHYQSVDKRISNSTESGELKNLYHYLLNYSLLVYNK